MDRFQDFILAEKVLNEYPTPIALACKPMMMDESTTGKTIAKAYDAIWAFVGTVITAQYIATGAPSGKINLFLMTTIRSMNSDKWIDVCKTVLPALTVTPIYQDLLAFYKDTVPYLDNPIDNFTRFKQRIGVEFLPPDQIELEDAKKIVNNILESLEFITELELIAAEEKGVFHLQGIQKNLYEGNVDIKPGQIILKDRRNTFSLLLNPLVKLSGEEPGIRYTNFKNDQDAYKQIVRIPSIAKSVQEYQNLLTANTDGDVEKNEISRLVSLDDLAKPINEALDDENINRILVEAYPGGGKTLLVSSFDELIPSGKFQIAKYFIEKGHVNASAKIFARFFYRKMNECLDEPMNSDTKDSEGNSFRENLIEKFTAENKKLVIVIDSIDSGLEPIKGEKYGIDQFLTDNLPKGVKLVMTTRTGLYPANFDRRIQIPPLTRELVAPLLSSETKLKETILGILNFYAGQRGYINEALRDNLADYREIPGGIAENLLRMLFRFNYFNPVKEQIFKYLAQENQTATLEEIAINLDISASVILEHLREMIPLVKTVNSKDGVKYELFMPALAHFVRNIKQYTTQEWKAS